ncbi:type VII secretion protein EccE [Nocardia callitridis]|uniref:Type VII secretion protein EccE n=1 Tax=Nocardia callitridis TaxID=648753 RepID=A0ABP9KWL3_9NOCA
MIVNQNVNEREIPATATLQDPEFWLFREMPLRLLVPVALIAAAVGWVAVALNAPTLVAVAIGAVVLLIGIAPVRKREPRTPAGMFARSIGYRWRRSKPGPEETDATAFDVPLPEGGSYGMRWDGGLLITMLRIDPPPDALTLLRPGSLATDQVLALDEIARCLGQFDINLASIDVISTGARTASVGAVAQLYDRIVGPLPAIAHRTVWLVLRLEPLANADAVESRGGGSTGALRTSIITTRRVANKLAAQGISTSVLTAGEMNSAVRQLTRNIPLEEFTETPNSLGYHGIHLTSYEIGPDLIGERGFADIWATPSLTTTVTVRVRQAPRRPTTVRDNEPTPITLGALVRFDTAFEPEQPPIAGLRRMPGRQFRALVDCLPTGSGRPSTSDYRGPLEALSDLAVPTAGCGQLIGADNTGQGIAVPLIGDGTRHLEVSGKLDLAQQVVLRAIALGARAVVHTDRPEAWHTMVSNVGAPHLLSLAPRSAGASHHPPPVVPNSGMPFPTATVVVFDGIPPTALTGGATVVHVRAPGQPSGFDADVILTQDATSPNRITVRTSTVHTTVNMVTTPDEMRYIGESLTAAR